MSDVVDRYLLASERVVFEVRRHWAALVKDGSVYGLFILGGFAALVMFRDIELLRLFAASFILLSTAWFGWFLLDWHVERLVVTPKRVILISGILTRRVAIMPLTKVTDLTYQQSVFGRLLDYGTFIVESAGQDQALSRIDYISGPDLHYQQISNLLFGTDAPTDPEDEDTTAAGISERMARLRRYIPARWTGGAAQESSEPVSPTATRLSEAPRLSQWMRSASRSNSAEPAAQPSVATVRPAGAGTAATSSTAPRWSDVVLGGDVGNPLHQTDPMPDGSRRQ